MLARSDVERSAREGDWPGHTIRLFPSLALLRFGLVNDRLPLALRNSFVKRRYVGGDAPELNAGSLLVCRVWGNRCSARQVDLLPFT